MSDALKAMTDFWSAQATAMLEAQQVAAKSMADGMQAMLAGKLPTMPAELTTPTAGLAQATEAVNQLWSAANQMSSELVGRLRGATGGDDTVASLFERMTDPRQWMSGAGGLDDVLTRLADGPRLADLWDLERRSARTLRAWAELRRYAFEQQRITLDAWMQAGRQYMEELAGHASADGKPLEPKPAFRLWTEVANRHLIQTQRSEPYLDAQRNLIRASTELRLAQSDLGEHIGKQYGLPTRTELDDVHRTLTEMRREMRRLRRALAEAKTARPEPAPPPLPIRMMDRPEARTRKRKEAS